MKFTTLTTAMTALALCSTTGVHAAPAKQKSIDGYTIIGTSSDLKAKNVSGELMQKTVSSLRQPPLVFLEDRNKDTKEEALASSPPPPLAKRTVNLEAETLNTVLLFIDQLPHRIAAAAASHNTTAAALVSDMHRGIDAAAGAKDATEVAGVARLRSLLADTARATDATTDVIAEQLHEAVAAAGEEAVNLKTTTTAGDGTVHQLGKRAMPKFGSGGTALPILVNLMQEAKKGKLKVMKLDDDEDDEDDLEKGGWPF